MEQNGKLLAKVLICLVSLVNDNLELQGAVWGLLRILCLAEWRILKERSSLVEYAPLSSQIPDSLLLIILGIVGMILLPSVQVSVRELWRL